MAEIKEIIVSNLKKNYKDLRGDVLVFDNFSLAIKGGEFLTIFGTNGCGKTTLLHILAGLEPFNNGNIEYIGEKFENIKIGMVFQDYQGSLFNWLNTLDNIIFPMFVKNASKKSILQKEARKFLEEYKFFELLPNLNAYPYQLSGGQQQLVAIARALFIKPDILFFDEPFSVLDFQNREIMQLSLQRYWLKERKTIIFVSHEIDEAIHLAERFVLVSPKPMYIIEELKINFEHPRTKKLYNREEFHDIRKKILLMLTKEAIRNE